MNIILFLQFLSIYIYIYIYIYKIVAHVVKESLMFYQILINGTTLLSCLQKYLNIISFFQFSLYIYKIVAHVVKESLTFYQILINGTTLLSCCCCCKIKRGGLTYEYYFILFLWIILLFVINYSIISIWILFHSSN